MKKHISYLILSILMIVSCSNNTDIKFDSIKWKNWKETESTTSLRWDMRKDLIENYKIKGQSKEEIKKLLGDPDQTIKDQFLYNLGMAKKGIDYGTLILIFKNGKVTDHKIVRG